MPDLWVQVEVGLPTSKLVDRGRAATGLDTDQVIGKLTRLWLACMTVGCGLTVGERSDGWIEEAVGWRGQQGVFAQYIRDHHLDGTAIQGWSEKYGRLDTIRSEAARIKRLQRQRYASGVRPPDGPPDGPLDRPLAGPPDVQVDPSTISNLHLLSQSETEKRAVQERALLLATDPVHQFTEEFDFGEWRPIVQGFIRSSPVPASVMADLRLHCTGAMHYPKSDPRVVGFALNQYMAEQGTQSMGRLKPAYFAGFVRRAQGTEQKRTAEANLVVEERAKVERQAEEQDTGQIVARFAMGRPERYAELSAQAEASVPTTVKMGRSILVRSALVTLVREEQQHASQ